MHDHAELMHYLAAAESLIPMDYRGPWPDKGPRLLWGLRVTINWPLLRDDIMQRVAAMVLKYKSDVSTADADNNFDALVSPYPALRRHIGDSAVTYISVLPVRCAARKYEPSKFAVPSVFQPLEDLTLFATRVS